MSKKQPNWIAVIDSPTAAIAGHSIKEKAYPHCPVALVPTPFKPSAAQHFRTVLVARLIAAAPELLKALESLIKWAETDKHAPGGSFSHLAEHVIPKASAAIRKAKGGAK